jgi:nitroreductase
MELDACVRGRRSIRSYKDKPVAKKAVEAIIDAGKWAPSGMNEQPLRLIVVEGKAAIGRISKRTKEILLSKEWGAEFRRMLESEHDVIFYGAPLLLLVCIERDEQWKSVRLLDAGLAAQNMFLKAYELGLGSCFIGFGNFLNADPEFLGGFGVPATHELVAPLIFGEPAEKPEPKPRVGNVLKWVE